MAEVDFENVESVNKMKMEQTHTHLPSNNTKWLSDILFNRNLFIHCSDIWKFVVEPLTWIGTAINEYYNISAFCFALALVLLDFSGSLNIFASITYEIAYTHTLFSQNMKRPYHGDDTVHCNVHGKKKLNEQTNHRHSIIMCTSNCIRNVARSKFNGEIIVRLKRAHRTWTPFGQIINEIGVWIVMWCHAVLRDAIDDCVCIADTITFSSTISIKLKIHVHRFVIWKLSGFPRRN